MHQLRALISQSPEELPEAFFKEFKKFNSDYKIKVWSRKDPLPGDYDFYFLSHRDFVYLKKNKLLPLSEKIILLATSLSVESAFSESDGEKIGCFIAGNEEARGQLAAEFFVNLCKMSQGLLPRHIEAEGGLEILDRMTVPAWMKDNIHHALLDLVAWNPQSKLNFRMEEDHEVVIIMASIEGDLPSLELFGHTFHHSHIGQLNHDSLKLLTLKSLFSRVSQTILFRAQGQKIIFELKFKKVKTQKKYESLPKLFGLNQLRGNDV